MRTRTVAVTATLAAVLSVAACDGNSSSDATITTPATTSTTADGSLHLRFGQTYTWPDGVKVSVSEAKVFTDYDTSSGEKPTPGSTDYQVMIRITNDSRTSFDLSELSVITDGATNGGQAAATAWVNGAPGLEGRLAPGVTATKADAETLEKRFGRKVVVTVQRSSSPDVTYDFPEFSGSITD